MPDQTDGTWSLLIVDDRSPDPSPWQREAARLDPRIVVRVASSAVQLQQAILAGGWLAIICPRNPGRLSFNAVLAMTQVLDPVPALLLHGELRTPDDRRSWLAAALRVGSTTRATRVDKLPVPTPVPRADASADVGTMDVPSMFGAAVTSIGIEDEAMQALRESEDRFRTLTEIAPVGIFLTDPSQTCLYVNERWSAITGVATRDALGRDWRATLDMEQDALKATSLFEKDPSQPLDFECRIERDKRNPTWVIGQMRPCLDRGGNIIGHLGVITDITERKEAELAMRESEKRLRDLAKHMTSVEERQRASIAREIHDDIGSSLTGMKIDVMRLKQLTAGNDEAQEKLAAFTRLLDSVAASTTRIAKALRPGILDDGIVPAIDWQLREFSKRMDIDTDFTEPEREPKLSADQSIALFRVVQELLNNVAKHANAKHVDVVLFAQGDELTLEIRDDGCGLPPPSAKPPPQPQPQTRRIDRRAGGFGITGMRERILSLGGWMDITGAPGKGTTVMCGIPMDRRG